MQLNAFCFKFSSPWRLCVRLNGGKVDGHNGVIPQLICVFVLYFLQKGTMANFFLVQKWIIALSAIVKADLFLVLFFGF